MSDNSTLQGVSSFFFPLRTNAGFYESPEGYLNLIEKIKQASLVYDKLIFEGGLYSSTFWETGHWDVYHSPSSVEKQQLEWMKKNFTPTGGESAIFVQAGNEEPVPLVSGEVVRRFQCEFHSVLSDLNAASLPWIEEETFELTEIGKQRTKEMANFLLNGFRAAIPERNERIFTRVLSNFCRDMIITSGLNAAASIHGLYAMPLIHGISANRAPGFAALDIVVPNVSQLSWEEIVELRNHPAWIEFRKKLLELETRVKAALPDVKEDEIQYIFALFQAFTQELTTELASYQPKTGQIIGNVAIDLVVSLIPAPGLGAAFTGLRGFGAMEEAKSSWVAAFLKTQKPSG